MNEPIHHRDEYARKPLLAVLLSVAATGLGHIYCGRLVKGLILFFASFAFAPLIVAAAQSAASTFMLMSVIGALVLMLGIFVYAVVDAALLARKLRSGYHLKEYNRWYLYLLFIVVAVSYPTNLAHTIRSHVLQAFKVPSVSMAPGVLPGDYVLLNKAAYKTDPPQRGDVVIFVYPDDRRLNYLKRIVALPGETVEIRDNVVWINDQPLIYGSSAPLSALNVSDKNARIAEEINAKTRYPILVAAGDPQSMPKITVPHGQCFVLGDNRSQSMDSRHFGPIPLSDIKGRLDYIYWPAQSWSRFGPYRH